MADGQGIFEGYEIPDEDELGYEVSDEVIDGLDLSSDEPAFSSDKALEQLPQLTETAGESAAATPATQNGSSFAVQNGGLRPQAVQVKYPDQSTEVWIPEAYPHERAHALGMSTLAVGIGTVAGMRWGGVYGALSGSLFAGAALNAYRALQLTMRADAASRREAAISGSYAVATGMLAGYLAYRGHKTKTEKKRKRD